MCFTVHIFVHLCSYMSRGSEMVTLVWLLQEMFPGQSYSFGNSPNNPKLWKNILLHKTHIKTANSLKPAELTAGRFSVDEATCSSNLHSLSFWAADSVTLLQLSEDGSHFALDVFKVSGCKGCKKTCIFYNLSVSSFSKTLFWQKYKTYLNIANTLCKWPFSWNAHWCTVCIWKAFLCAIFLNLPTLICVLIDLKGQLKKIHMNGFKTFLNSQQLSKYQRNGILHTHCFPLKRGKCNVTPCPVLFNFHEHCQ